MTVQGYLYDYRIEYAAAGRDRLDTNVIAFLELIGEFLLRYFPELLPQHITAMFLNSAPG